MIVKISCVTRQTLPAGLPRPVEYRRRKRLPALRVHTWLPQSSLHAASITGLLQEAGIAYKVSTV